MKLSATISVSRRPRTDNEAELASVITNKTMQMGLKDFDQAVKDLKGAGIVVGEDQMTLEASKVKITNNGTTAALFTDGKVSASYLDAKTIVTNGLSANTIDANSATIKNLTVDNATGTNFTFKTGKVGNFKIENSYFYSYTTYGSIQRNEVIYNNRGMMVMGYTSAGARSGRNLYAGIVADSPMQSFHSMLHVEDTSTDNNTIPKYGININVGGNNSGYNNAINILGGYVGGLALKPQVVTSTATVSTQTNIVIINTSSNITLTLPDLGTDDKYAGRVLIIKKILGNLVTIKASGSNYISWGDSDGTQTKQSYDQLYANWCNRAIILVFIPTLTSGTLKGAWVEFKMSPNW